MNKYKFKKIGHQCFIEIDGKEKELKVSVTKKGDYAYIADYIEGREWLSMTRIEKENEWIELEMKSHEKRTMGSLTEEEKKRIAQLEAEIKAIKDAARARKPIKFEQMNREEQIEYLKAQYEKLTGEKLKS